jgi:YfiH family protein
MNTRLLTEQALTKNDWQITEVAGLQVVRSPLLEQFSSLAHAFTTRHGAASPAPLDSFNLGRHWPSEESRLDAMENRRRLCEALGLEVDKLTVPGQQHTTNIYIVDAASACHTQRLPELDGAATDTAGLPILLHFADCVPVMIYDKRQHVLCVMHAGWRGTAGGIAANGVRLLQERFQSQTQDIVGAIGPAIGSCCYPTGNDVAAQLAQSVQSAEGLIIPHESQPRPDLKAINAMQLLESGVREVDVTSWCTACHPELFYSHRQAGGKTGRQGAIACIK